MVFCLPAGVSTSARLVGNLINVTRKTFQAELLLSTLRFFWNDKPTLKENHQKNAKTNMWAKMYSFLVRSR